MSQTQIYSFYALVVMAIVVFGTFSIAILSRVAKDYRFSMLMFQISAVILTIMTVLILLLIYG